MENIFAAKVTSVNDDNIRQYIEECTRKNAQK